MASDDLAARRARHHKVAEEYPGQGQPPRDVCACGQRDCDAAVLGAALEEELRTNDNLREAQRKLAASQQRQFQARQAAEAALHTQQAIVHAYRAVADEITAALGLTAEDQRPLAVVVAEREQARQAAAARVSALTALLRRLVRGHPSIAAEMTAEDCFAAIDATLTKRLEVMRQQWVIAGQNEVRAVKAEQRAELFAATLQQISDWYESSIPAERLARLMSQKARQALAETNDGDG